MMTPGFPSRCTIIDRLRAVVDATPHKEVYRFIHRGSRLDDVLTYAQLWRKVRALGALLRELGFTGGRALILLPQGLDYMVAFFGSELAGLTPVTLYPPETRSMARFAAVINDCDPCCAFVTSDALDLIEATIERHPALRTVRWLPFDELSLEGDDGGSGVGRIAGESLAFLQYTSGSTSAPKGVMVSHGNLMACMELQTKMGRMSVDSVIVGWMPLFHDFALIGKALQAVALGARAVLMAPSTFVATPASWLRAISEHQGTHAGAPNFGYQACVDAIDEDELAGIDLRSWRVAWNGAEPVREATLRAFARRFEAHGFAATALAPSYGLAEATLLVSAGGDPSRPWTSVLLDRQALAKGQLVPLEPQAGGGVTIVGCGKPGTEVMIVDVDTRLPCPPDRVGEIWVRGPTLARGYWRRPEETSLVFQARLASDVGEARYLRTGDLGFIRFEELYVVGRLKDLIVIRGHNHHPQDIELTVEGVDSSFRRHHTAAFTVGEDGDALVVLQEVQRSHLRTVDPPRLFAAAKRAIWTEHGLELAALVLLRPGELLKTTSGKVQRSASKLALLEGALAVLASEGVATPIAKAAAATAEAEKGSPHA